MAQNAWACLTHLLAAAVAVCRPWVHLHLGGVPQNHTGSAGTGTPEQSQNPARFPVGSTSVSGTQHCGIVQWCCGQIQASAAQVLLRCMPFRRSLSLAVRKLRSANPASLPGLPPMTSIEASPSHWPDVQSKISAQPAMHTRNNNCMWQTIPGATDQIETQDNQSYNRPSVLGAPYAVHWDLSLFHLAHQKMWR